MRAAGVIVVGAAIAAVLGYRLAASSSSTASSSGVDASLDVLPRTQRRALGVADGAVPNGTTVFDGAIPGVANLDPALVGALRRAATAAAGDGIGLVVDSGWRSPEYQERLLREAVSKYGSLEEATRWVATPSTSAHVSGDAVDIGPPAAAAWLSEHGAVYGLCRIYGNEPWHYELRADAADLGCPPMYADAAHDPRMVGSPSRLRRHGCADEPGCGRTGPALALREPGVGAPRPRPSDAYSRVGAGPGAPPAEGCLRRGGPCVQDLRQHAPGDGPPLDTMT